MLPDCVFCLILMLLLQKDTTRRLSEMATAESPWMVEA